MGCGVKGCGVKGCGVKGVWCEGCVEGRCGEWYGLRVCVSLPCRLHEALLHTDDITSMLLDIDHRYVSQAGVCGVIWATGVCVG